MKRDVILVYDQVEFDYTAVISIPAGNNMCCTIIERYKEEKKTHEIISKAYQEIAKYKTIAEIKSTHDIP